MTCFLSSLVKMIDSNVNYPSFTKNRKEFSRHFIFSVGKQRQCLSFAIIAGFCSRSKDVLVRDLQREEYSGHTRLVRVNQASTHEFFSKILFHIFEHLIYFYSSFYFIL